MKHYMTFSALVLTGAMLLTACGNKEQKTETNENPTSEKVEVKEVGLPRFADTVSEPNFTVRLLALLPCLYPLILSVPAAGAE